MEKPVGKKYPSVTEVDDAERVRMVKEIFSTITRRYDFLNHFLSLRRDVAWRRFTAKKMEFFDTRRYLDVACGTLDLAMEAANRHPDITICAADFVTQMLDAGAKKIAGKKCGRRIHLFKGDAMKLPFKDNSFDVTGIAFGIRNIPDREGALREMARVTVPGGQVMVLEMTAIRSRFLKALYRFYLSRMLPCLAGQFTANTGAYHYLSDSIIHFPSPDEFLRLMESCGMDRVKKHILTLGVTYLYIGRKKG